MTRQIFILTCFCCLLSDVFFQIMCIASFNFNLNGVEAEPIISKQFSVILRIYLTSFIINKICKNVGLFMFPNAP